MLVMLLVMRSTIPFDGIHFKLVRASNVWLHDWFVAFGREIVSLPRLRFQPCSVEPTHTKSKMALFELSTMGMVESCTFYVMLAGYSMNETYWTPVVALGRFMLF